MRHRWLWVLGLVMAAALSLVDWGGKAQTPARKTWEYKVVIQYGVNPMSPSLGEADLNKLGAEGWELVETRAGSVGPGQVRTDYVFKRVR
ncbi:MAG TPA: DUF4177 domain-containing protein [Pyrinomonadaceae bacterium]|jgi:predicted porin